MIVILVQKPAGLVIWGCHAIGRPNLRAVPAAPTKKREHDDPVIPGQCQKNTAETRIVHIPTT